MLKKNNSIIKDSSLAILLMLIAETKAVFPGRSPGQLWKTV